MRPRTLPLMIIDLSHAVRAWLSDFHQVKRWVPLAERQAIGRREAEILDAANAVLDRMTELRDLTICAREAADWLCETPVGTDQYERGIRLQATLDRLQAGPIPAPTVVEGGAK